MDTKTLKFLSLRTPWRRTRQPNYGYLERRACNTQKNVFSSGVASSGATKGQLGPADIHGPILRALISSTNANYLATP